MRFKVEIEARLTSYYLSNPINARFHSQDTLSRHLHFFNCQRTSVSFDHRLSLFLAEGNESASEELLDLLSVERKGFEPSTPGLQSRCSPS